MPETTNVHPTQGADNTIAVGACHEGSYGLPGMLVGGRLEEERLVSEPNARLAKTMTGGKCGSRGVCNQGDGL